MPLLTGRSNCYVAYRSSIYHVRVVILSLCQKNSGGVSIRSKRNTELSETSETSENTCPQFELLRGRDGDNGRDGRDGLPGSPGTAGRDGKDGEKGDRGFNGEKGDHGIDGLPGYGMKGMQGLPGIKGSRGLQGPPGVGTGGTMYTRWGRTTCPSTPGTQLVYSGRAAGSHYNHQGGASNYLCMPANPEYSSYKPGVFGPSYVYGAEYQTANGGSGLLSSSNNNNVPCAVCYTSLRGTVLMLPAKISCPHSWTREYWGYLMSAATIYSDHYRTRFECLDRNPEAVPGSAANTNGALFHHTEATCNGLPCPPYDTQKELTCAVCTK